MYVNEHEAIHHYTQIQIKVKEQLVVRKDMYVNEHEAIHHYTQIQIKVNEQQFYCYSIFCSDSGVFKNEHFSYPKINVQRPQLAVQQ